jgi:hypothetical protein
MSNPLASTVNPVVSGQSVNSSQWRTATISGNATVELSSDNLVLLCPALAGNTTLTFPSAASQAGRQIKIVCTAAPANNLILSFPANSLYLHSLVKADSAANSYTQSIISNGTTTLTLTGNRAVIGDTIDIVSNGIHWKCFGVSNCSTNNAVFAVA